MAPCNRYVAVVNVDKGFCQSMLIDLVSTPMTSTVDYRKLHRSIG